MSVNVFKLAGFSEFRNKKITFRKNFTHWVIFITAAPHITRDLSENLIYDFAVGHRASKN